MKLLCSHIVLIILILFAFNCDGSSNQNLALLALAIQNQPGIEFKAVVGDSDATCGGDITGHGESHSSSVTIQHVAGVMPIGLKDLRFYVSEFELVDQNDNVITLDVPNTGDWQYAGVALLDFENGKGSCSGTTETNNFVQASVENKTYKTLRFTLGVPENLNHIDYSVAPSPLNVSGLAWSWTMGYRFFVGEFLSNDPATLGNAAVLHMGSAGCSESAGVYTCTNSNRAKIELTPTEGFNPFTQKVQFDLKKAVTGWDISTGSKSCHSMGAMDSSTCSLVYPNFGLDYSTGNAGSAAQTVFGIVSK
ncbi:MbnP family copper-binding protein [Leptospira licerasiae]|uniref:AZL_007920/MXAN_0976 family protein n=1 Tax=Leptospira licerasiae str. MMD4847 TaxID=1049971 RepID=A0ABN0H996_9LEPT|nr:MbnP family copper-binding protein [Leptospira licerasiae]EIE03444.1 AZL_007920/MXAN_0976 family protein [Leptospira licerasiae serovar Varillal str. VAR 010]EJZ42224.1 AZL_007920/MXAN_0976 family protein [Leptospira licerasiae str. MMD4847]